MAIRLESLDTDSERGTSSGIGHDPFRIEYIFESIDYRVSYYDSSVSIPCPKAS